MRRTHGTPWLALGLSAALLSPGAAQAKGIYSGKVSLSGFLYAESDGIDVTNGGDATVKTAAAARLAYGDLRATVDARRIAKEKLDFHLDVRLRLTGSLDFESKFGSEFFANRTTDSAGTSSRGYLGGPEYDLREAYVNVRFTEQLGLQVGRMFIAEADSVKLDGVRLWRQFGAHWTGTLFVGGYPNPYSRSLLSDYEPPCSAGVAGERGNSAASTGACAGEGRKLGFAAGAGARYSYKSLWGSVGVVGSFFGGLSDGGPVQINPLAKDYNAATTDVGQANLLEPDAALDAPRVYLAWLNAWRPIERFDLFSDLVFDAYGSGGPQLTRLVLLGTLRVLPTDRLTLRIGASYMSSLAINMYLNRMVYNRISGVTPLSQGISFVENNLTILRTGRAEGRLTLDSLLVRRLGGFVEGRVRFRTLLGGDSVPGVYDDRSLYGSNTSSLAGDGTIGLRDTGSVAGLRGSLSYSFISDFRATNHVINFDIGREFWQDRIGLTLNYVAAITKDKGSPDEICGPTSPFRGCFGLRSGMTHEVGLLATLNPWRTLFVVADYRFIALLTDARGTTTYPPTLSHSILARVEFRW